MQKNRTMYKPKKNRVEEGPKYKARWPQKSTSLKKSLKSMESPWILVKSLKDPLKVLEFWKWSLNIEYSMIYCILFPNHRCLEVSNYGEFAEFLHPWKLWKHPWNILEFCRENFMVTEKETKNEASLVNTKWPTMCCGLYPVHCFLTGRRWIFEAGSDTCVWDSNPEWYTVASFIYWTGISRHVLKSFFKVTKLFQWPIFMFNLSWSSYWSNFLNEKSKWSRLAIKNNVLVHVP